MIFPKPYLFFRSVASNCYAFKIMLVLLIQPNPSCWTLRLFLRFSLLTSGMQWTLLYAGLALKICHKWGGLDVGSNRLEWAVLTDGCLAIACVPTACTVIFAHTCDCPWRSVRKRNSWAAQRVREHLKTFRTCF